MADTIDKPVLIRRWRLENKELKYLSRHMRALSACSVVTPELLAWVKEHIEWTLSKGAFEHPNGVLMLVVDSMRHAAMAVGPYLPIDDISAVNLLGIAQDSASSSEVPQDVLMSTSPDILTIYADSDIILGGFATLVIDIAKTRGLKIDYCSIPRTISADTFGVFLASDEHGAIFCNKELFETFEKELKR